MVQAEPARMASARRVARQRAAERMRRAGCPSRRSQTSAARSPPPSCAARHGGALGLYRSGGCATSIANRERKPKAEMRAPFLIGPIANLDPAAVCDCVLAGDGEAEP